MLFYHWSVAAGPAGGRNLGLLEAAKARSAPLAHEAAEGCRLGVAAAQLVLQLLVARKERVPFALDLVQLLDRGSVELRAVQEGADHLGYQLEKRLVLIERRLSLAPRKAHRCKGGPGI